MWRRGTIAGLLFLAALTACGGPPELAGIFLFSADKGPQGPAGLYSAAATGKRITNLLADETALSPRWDPVGRKVYYTAQFAGGREVAALALDNKSTAQVSDVQPMLAQRLADLAAQRKAAEERDLEQFGWVKPDRTTPIVRFDPAFPSPTRDGRFVAFAILPRRSDFQPIYRGEVHVMEIGKPGTLIIATEMFSPDWMPTGCVAVAGGGGKIAMNDFGVAPTSGTLEGKEHIIYEDQSDQGEIQSPRLSHSGTRVAWVQGQGLLVAPVSGGPATTLASAKNFKLPGAGILPSFVAWSPDDQYLAVVAGLNMSYNTGGIFIFRADGKPVYKSVRSFQVEGIRCRVDAIDWVEKL